MPPATTVAGPDFVMARSAEAVTPVVTEDVLFPGTGSLVVLAMLAVLVSDAAWEGAVTTIVIVGAVAPAANAGRVHATEAFPVFVQVHPVPTAEGCPRSPMTRAGHYL